MGKKRLCDPNLPIICGIYKITSPSNRIYIGQSIDIYNRFAQYDRLINCKEQPILYNSLRKYTGANHIKEIIKECEFDQLNNQERYWQEYYDCVENGLNCIYTSSDEKSKKYSEETRRKISLSAKKRIRYKRIFSEQAKRNISEGQKGKKLSKEHVEKIKINSRRKIYQYDLDGNFIKEWESTLKAATELGLNKTSIQSCCSKRIIHTGRFIWRRYKVNNMEDFLKEIESFSRRATLPILQKNIITGEEKIWKSAREIYLTKFISREKLEKILSGKLESYNNCIFKKLK